MLKSFSVWRRHTNKESIRQAVLSLGADVCGFAAVDRFLEAPEGFRPNDVFPDCKTVIVYGMALPKGLFSVSPEYIYAYFNETISVPAIDRIGLRLARLLEEEDVVALPIPCDWPVAQYDEETCTKRGILSMKHAAVAAGIGALGKNTLLLSPAFGNCLTIGAVLTNAAFSSDPLAESICLPGCTLCLYRCPANAISEGHVTQRPCREHTYVSDTLGFAKVLCNLCRSVCPMRFGKKDT